jgi:P27 family predicted phage terminase small subunit
MAKGIDWDFIRIEYEETTKSIRLIATENAITHGAIQRRAKKENWSRGSLDVINDKSLTKASNPILKRHALRKIEEIKNELGDNYSVLDEPLVIAFALNYQKWIATQEILLEENSIEVSSKGSLYISPYENLAKMYENSFIKIAGQIGLSLASRKRIGVSTKSDSDEASLFEISGQLENYDVDV